MTPRSSQAVDAFDRPIKPVDAGTEGLSLFAAPDAAPVRAEIPVLLEETPDDPGHVATVDPAFYPGLVE